MAPVVVPAVDQDRVEDVVGRVLGVSLLEELVQRQLFWELKPGEQRESRGMSVRVQEIEGAGERDEREEEERRKYRGKR